MTTKTCTKCGETKPTTEFYKNKHAKDGLCSRCKKCESAQSKRWRDENIEKSSALSKKWYQENREQNRETKRKWQQANPEKIAAQDRKRKYGLTQATFDTMLDAQNHNCAICGTALLVEKGKHAVDHDHNTGAVRGILCRPCNTGIGHLKDKPSLLRSAADYLETHNAKQKGDLTNE